MIKFGEFIKNQNNQLQMTPIKIKGNTPIDNSLKIIHLSDLHGKQFGKDNNLLYTKIVKNNPDLIVFTGDLVGDLATNLEACLTLLIRLNHKTPVIYIPGNHEHRSGRVNYITETLKGEGVCVLRNKITSLTIKGIHVNLLGIDEEQGSYKNYLKRKIGHYRYTNYNKLFKALEQKSGLKIVLCHYPENFANIGKHAYNQYQFDVMLAGHAHGGQFILPFVGGVYAPGQGFFPKYYQGLYGKGPYMVVSRGLGNSSFPLRLFNRPEIVLLAIH